MAKLFGEMRSESGIEVHKIANKQLCADFYYGSRERSIKAVTVCTTVMPTIGEKEKAIVTAEFVSPQGYVTHYHKEEHPMPEKRILLERMVTI